MPHRYIILLLAAIMSCGIAAAQDSEQAMLRKADTAFSSGNYTAAWGLYVRVYADFDNSYAMKRRDLADECKNISAQAAKAEAGGDYAEAARLYEKLLTKNPDDKNASRQLQRYSCRAAGSKKRPASSKKPSMSGEVPHASAAIPAPAATDSARATLRPSDASAAPAWSAPAVTHKSSGTVSRDANGNYTRSSSDEHTSTSKSGNVTVTAKSIKTTKVTVEIKR